MADFPCLQRLEGAHGRLEPHVALVHEFDKARGARLVLGALGANLEPARVAVQADVGVDAL